MNALTIFHFGVNVAALTMSRGWLAYEELARVDSLTVLCAAINPMKNGSDFT